MRSEGKIYEHSVDNVVLRDPPLGISPLWTSLSRIFNPQPQPCPGAQRVHVLDGCRHSAPMYELSMQGRQNNVGADCCLPVSHRDKL